MRTPSAGTGRPRAVPARHLTLLLALLAVLIGTGALAGCGEESEPGGDKAAAGDAFPVTVTGANGKVTLDSKPSKIVSLSPTATEMLFAIDAGDQVVAVDDQSNYPADAPKTDLSGFKPNAEAIAGKSPDLVVLSNDSDGIVDALGKIKVPVLLLTAATKLTDTYDQIETLGKATDHAEKASKLVESIKGDLETIVEDTPKTSLTYYHELDNTYFSATSRTFVGEVYSLFGLKNVADEAAKAGNEFPQLSSEYLVKADPDLIFLADTKCCQQSADTVAKRPGFATVSAVKSSGVAELDDDIASRWGPRVVDFARAVSEAVKKHG
jgi:iron complex transport system substrate-binding protein